MNRPLPHPLAKSMIAAYLRLLGAAFPAQLAFDCTESKVLVWAVLTDDEALERTLILAEAQVNARYHTLGLDMETTLTQPGEHSVPPQYQPFRA